MDRKAQGRWGANFHEHFQYDEGSITGLAWARDSEYNRPNVKVGLPTGYLCSHKNKDYFTVQLYYYAYTVHQIVWILFNGLYDTKTLNVDHIDGNKKNNKISNLRLVSIGMNLRNSKMRKANKSGTTGVSYCPYFSKKLGRMIDLWMAHWAEGNKKKKSKSFSELKYENPKELAIQYRKEQIERLNKEGMGYTERHGQATISKHDI